MPCCSKWHLQRLQNTKLAVFCSPHAAVAHAVFERKRVWLQRHAEIYWWVHGIFQKQVSHSLHLTQATYFRGSLCWFHAEYWVWVGSSGWAGRRSSCFDQFNQTVSMGTSLRNKQAHADHAWTHGTCVTCTTVASETDTKKRKHGRVKHDF